MASVRSGSAFLARRRARRKAPSLAWCQMCRFGHAGSAARISRGRMPSGPAAGWRSCRRTALAESRVSCGSVRSGRPPRVQAVARSPCQSRGCL
eukprot:1102462-Alexandrium_andersonii.AAC.1